ncbi:hypothetical protein BS329_29240 [Amycolatopsis coloradensis]|uniref:Uncharacterized protein n=1 Tax=Amycolatopsis coloradensis TaxID=76021 RepID=A0A1R0KKK2_9PSEU|nr:hypothetical protein BS329_29240 [Amycolatopsis coloradensis]
MGRVTGRGFAAYLAPKVRVNAISVGSVTTSALEVVVGNAERYFSESGFGSSVALSTAESRTVSGAAAISACSSLLGASSASEGSSRGTPLFHSVSGSSRGPRLAARTK